MACKTLRIKQKHAQNIKEMTYIHMKTYKNPTEIYLFIYLFTNTVYMKIIYNNNSTLDRPESGLLGILNIILKSINCMVNMKINA